MLIVEGINHLFYQQTQRFRKAWQYFFGNILGVGVDEFIHIVAQGFVAIEQVFKVEICFSWYQIHFDMFQYGIGFAIFFQGFQIKCIFEFYVFCKYQLECLSSIKIYRSLTYSF